MSILTDSARSAVCRDGQIVIAMESGIEISFPVVENPRLARGTPEQLNRIEISPYGVHWPDLDEEPQLSSPGVDPDMISFFAKKLGGDEPHTDDGNAPLGGIGRGAQRTATRAGQASNSPSVASPSSKKRRE